VLATKRPFSKKLEVSDGVSKKQLEKISLPLWIYYVCTECLRIDPTGIGRPIH
jgi:hypothetical protein